MAADNWLLSNVKGLSLLQNSEYISCDTKVCCKHHMPQLHRPFISCKLGKCLGQLTWAICQSVQEMAMPSNSKKCSI